MRLRARRLAPLAIAIALVGAAACGEDDGGTADGPDAGQQSPTAPASPTASTPADSEATVAVSDSPAGQILVDSEGVTLYMFDPDEMGESTCYDDCEALWPPLAVTSDPVAGDGVDESLLGTVERDDGSTQVTYGDWPLYYYAEDTAAGEVNGQAFQEVWWVMDPQGQPVRGSGAGATGPAY